MAIQTSETAITASPSSRSKQKALRRLQHTGHLEDLVNRSDPLHIKAASAVEPPQNDVEDLGLVSGGSGDRSENDSNEDIGNVEKLSTHIFSTDDYPYSTIPMSVYAPIPGSNTVNSTNHSTHGDQVESDISASEKSNYPSLEERAKQQQDAILTFTALVKTLPEKSLDSLSLAVSLLMQHCGLFP